MYPKKVPKMANVHPVKVKSWSELQQSVKELTRQFSALSTKAPYQILFRDSAGDCEGSRRIYFLASGPWNIRETTLFYVDLPSSNNSDHACLNLTWYALIDPSFQTMGQLTKEEQLISERKRMVNVGITDYQYHENSGRFLFTVAGEMYQCIDTSAAPEFQPVQPEHISTSRCAGAKLNSHTCPSNPDLVAYINNKDIWVCHTKSGCECRLTFTHTTGSNIVENPLSAGFPSYVIQEEFDRYEGYWWGRTSNNGVYYIIYEEVDESQVQILNLPTSNNELGDVEQHRFPRPGTANAKSTLKMVKFVLLPQNEIRCVSYFQIKHSLLSLFPWMEYIVAVGWIDDDNLWIKLLDRAQRRLELVLISLDSFVSVDKADLTEQNCAGNFASINVLYQYNTDIWYKPYEQTNIPYFFPINTDENVLSFIWLGHETDFNHLYLVTAILDNDLHSMIEGVSLTPRVKEKVALTAGEWEVLPSNIWVDTIRNLVYFMGLRDSPLEKNLYVVSIKQPSNIRCLSTHGYSYSVAFSSDHQYFVASFSNTCTPTSCKVYRLYHTDIGVENIQVIEVGSLLEPPGASDLSGLLSDKHCPKMFRCKISTGEELFSMMYQPHNYQPGRQYPTVLNIYGGPEVQLVTNTYHEGMKKLRMYMMAANGFCVISIDSRGSTNRGLKFESHLQSKMGTVELLDQIEVLKWMSKTTGMIDMNRIAVHGWSYGGYLSLMALAHHPDVFKVAIAGAPVTSWELYDTGYTERYMGLPSQNPQGYSTGSVLNYVSLFPEEENRLLIVHGLIDENVHFFHTNQLITALIKAGKPYQLQVYPNERHSFRHSDSTEHYETMLLSFLLSHV